MNESAALPGGDGDGGCVVVTGAASGIGLAVTRWCVEQGYEVVAVDQDDARLRSLELGESVAKVHVDVADAVGVADVLEPICRGRQLVGAFLNAGVGHLGRLQKMTAEEMQRVVDVNLWGTVHCTRTLAPYLTRTGVEMGRPTSLVLMASVSGVRPTAGESIYSAAKAAIISLTASMALELAPHVRSNCVSPGVVESNLTRYWLGMPGVRAEVERTNPMSGVAVPDEVAEVVGFLLSHRSVLLNGQNLVLDSGASLAHRQTHELLSSMI